MTPLRALVYTIFGFGALSAFIVVIGSVTGGLDLTAALGVCGTVMTALIGVVGIRMAADDKKSKGGGDE